MFAVDEKSPLYLQIKRDIVNKIEKGTWQLSQKLPTEEDLEKQHKVSRGTVRRALSELEAEGYINRIAGRGTFVSRINSKLDRHFGKIYSFSEQLDRADYVQQTTVLTKAQIKAGAARGRVREAYGIPDGSELIHIRRLRAGNGVPFAIQSVYLLPDAFAGILDQDLTHLFKVYQEVYGRQIASADEVLTVARPSKEESRLLKLGADGSAIIRDRISSDQQGKVLEVLHSVERADMFKYHFVIVADLTEPAPNRSITH